MWLVSPDLARIQFLMNPHPWGIGYADTVAGFDSLGAIASGKASTWMDEAIRSADADLLKLSPELPPSLSTEPLATKPDVSFEVESRIDSMTDVSGGIALPDPSLDLPAFSSPDISFDMPNIDIADIEIPNIEVPNIEIPDIEVPSFDVPNIDTSSFDTGSSFSSEF